MTRERGARIRGLGEVALRVEDLDGMCAFYEDALGLSTLETFETSTFFDLGDGYGGHRQVLALFDRTTTDEYRGIESAHTSLDHLAFEIDHADYEHERERLEREGISVETAVHEWVGWRSLYVTDPEGNTVELVCHDPSV